MHHDEGNVPPMSTRLLPFEADRLRDQPLTYNEVGASLTAGPDGLPAGYRHLDEQFTVGYGAKAFEVAAARLAQWGVQRGVRGVRVSASVDRVEVGAVAVVRLGVGPLAVRAPVRVVAVVDEPVRRGFAYGTLAGHPECGEESFVLSFRDDDAVVLRIRAFSRAGSLLTRVGGPLGRVVQRVVTRAYGRALG
ncbi:MAG: hypothetical protein JWQ74_377 [Marmoricola sp.]|nr:hypothetical protein [Marmoricola sp.]